MNNEQRLYDMLADAASRLPIAEALRAVSETRIAQRNHASWIDAVREYQRAIEDGRAVML